MVDKLSLPTDLLQTLGWTLLHSLWQGTLVAAVFFVVLVFVKRSNLRYGLACATLVTMLLAPVATFALFYERPQTDVSSAELTPAVANEKQPATSAPAHTLTTPQPEPLEDNAVLQQPRLPNWRERLAVTLPYLVGFWILGVVLLSLRLVLQWLYAERFKRRHTKLISSEVQQRLRELTLRLRMSRPVQLLESSLVDAPTVIGFIKPVILLPTSALTGLSLPQLESLLIHELAHIRRHDYLVNILQSVIETLLFYHPAVWWVSHRIRVEREHCCDVLGQPYTLRLTVKDALGERELFHENMLADESVETLLHVYGEASAQLFVNDVLFMTWNP
jgi:beta-lactamase regulating signal transducer with metallopeptidase domain